MKLFKILTILGAVCLIAIACTEKSPTTTGQVEPTETKPPSQVAESASAELAEIDGTLTQTEKGLAIVTDTETYVVTGKDLSDMIGKTVKVTGAIAEVDGSQIIEVMSVMPVE